MPGRVILARHGPADTCLKRTLEATSRRVTAGPRAWLSGAGQVSAALSGVTSGLVTVASGIGINVLSEDATLSRRRLGAHTPTPG